MFPIDIFTFFVENIGVMETKNMYYETNSSSKLAAKIIVPSVLLGLLAMFITFFFPAEGNDTYADQAELVSTEDNLDKNKAANLAFAFSQEHEKLSLNTEKKEDLGLILYSQPQSRSEVEFYYYRVVNDYSVAQAILQEAERYNIPLSLAFALAHTESNFNARAMNRNKNGSIDRGLFQLNSSSFPKLSESDFYNPETSAHYGLSHLRFCLDTAGNEITALAMYNAGTGKVRNDNTPQITLNYISKIQSYRQNLEEKFAEEVSKYYNPDWQKSTYLAQNF